MNTKEDHSTIVNNAYSAHVAMYAARNPMPVVRVPPSKIITMPVYQKADRLITGSMAVMLIASVIVSGSRTITEFGGGITGLAAFVMLEGGIISYAYFKARRLTSKATIHSTGKMAWAGILMALLISLVANLHATAKINRLPIPDYIDTIIIIMIGLSAPIMAYISGDLLGVETVITSNSKAKAETAYQDELRAAAKEKEEALERMQNSHGAALTLWRKEMNADWELKKVGLIRKYTPVEIPNSEFQDSIPKLEFQSENSIPKKLETERKIPKKLESGIGKWEVAENWFMEDPTRITDSAINLVEIGKEIGVGKQTMYDVRNTLKVQK